MTMTSETLVNHFRRFLLVLTGFILSGSVIELYLETHTKETLQWIPFFLCAAGLIVVVRALMQPKRSTLLALRVVMAVVALGGVLGGVLHLWYNFTFLQELHPEAATFDLFMAAFKGANPLMAPGVLVLAGFSPSRRRTITRR